MLGFDALHLFLFKPLGAIVPAPYWRNYEKIIRNQNPAASYHVLF